MEREVKLGWNVELRLTLEVELGVTRGRADFELVVKGGGSELFTGRYCGEEHVVELSRCSCGRTDTKDHVVE